MGRPDNLRRLIWAYNNTKGSLPIYVVLDAQDAYLYDDVQLPNHWKRCTVPAGTRLGRIFNLIFKTFPNESFYGMVADDVIPETPHWDTILAEACHPNKIAWGMDGIQDEKLPVHPFIGGSLVRSLGWWAAPGIKHWFVDNAWKDLATELEIGNYLPQVRMTHHHFVNGKSQLDKTYQNQPNHYADELAYVQFLQNEFPNAIKRAREGFTLNENTSGGRSLSS